MNDEQFIDIYIDGLIRRIPVMQMQHREPQRFLRELADRSAEIVALAAGKGDRAQAYAERRVGVMLLGFRTASRLRVVRD